LIRFLFARESFLNGEKRKGHGKRGALYRASGEGVDRSNPYAVGEFIGTILI